MEFSSTRSLSGLCIPARLMMLTGVVPEHRDGHVFFLDKPWTPIHVDTITHDFLELKRYVFPKKTDPSFHSLRHTFYTWLADAGTPIHTIKRLAGHASIETTMQYVHAMDDGRDHIHEAFGS